MNLNFKSLALTIISSSWYCWWLWQKLRETLLTLVIQRKWTGNGWSASVDGHTFIRDEDDILCSKQLYKYECRAFWIIFDFGISTSPSFLPVLFFPWGKTCQIIITDLFFSRLANSIKVSWQLMWCNWESTGERVTSKFQKSSLYSTKYTYPSIHTLFKLVEHVNLLRLIGMTHTLWNRRWLKRGFRYTLILMY